MREEIDMDRVIAREVNGVRTYIGYFGETTNIDEAIRYKYDTAVKNRVKVLNSMGTGGTWKIMHYDKVKNLR